MAKNKKGKKGAKPGKGKGKPKGSIAPKATLASHAKTAHVHAACSILDPFCISARAAKRPDGAGANAISFQCRGSFPYTTDATGAAMFIIVPGIKFGYAIPTLAANIWTMPAVWGASPGTSFVNTNALEARIVSLGVKFTSVASATNSQGLVTMFSHNNATLSGTYNALNGNYPEVQQGPLKSGTELTWLAKPCNGAKSHMFRPYTEFTTTMTDFDWTQLGIELVGGPVSTTVAYLEVVCNVEFTLNPTGVTTTGLSGTVAKPRAANPVALQAQAVVHSSMSSFIEGGVKAVEGAVTKAASSALSSLEDFGLSSLFAML